MSKLKLLMCADDPDSNLSYGILSRMLIDEIHQDYDIHYLSLQYPMGKPINMGKYTKYPAHNQGERNPTFLLTLFKNLNPDIFWTNFDIQHYINVDKFVPPGTSWIGWVPWDNHDTDQVPRAQQAFRKVDTRIAISKFGYEFLNSNGVRIDDWIYNCINTNVFKPLKEDDPRLLKFKELNPWLTEDIKILLFVGRPNWRKRIMHMLGIMKELVDRGNKNFRLFLHSNLDDPARTVDIRELIDAFGLKDYIIASQFYWDMGIPEEDLQILYNIADLYLAPHGGEGFGMPIVEAMACGTPFVASDITTTREFAGENNERGVPLPVHYPLDENRRIRKDRGVSRPYPNIKESADIIEQLLMDEKRLKRMGQNGIKWAHENCSPQVIAEKWRKVFDIYDVKYARVIGYND